MNNIGKYDINQVYYAESQNAPINPIAIRPHIQKNIISWEDTSRIPAIAFAEIKFDGKNMEEIKDLSNFPPSRIDITSKQGKTYTLFLLTQEVFREKAKKDVAGGDTLLDKTTEELQQYYLDTF